MGEFYFANMSITFEYVLSFVSCKGKEPNVVFEMCMINSQNVARSGKYIGRMFFASKKKMYVERM